ncbi:hypothetical protein GCM10022399_41230 [Terrabacter ginsenosidimutans]|uniref:Uncharacterized protein n=1 Tax=Terrabacter ginsenosidimutans TaxID=490575 RepID=A0ABP7EMR7_9MICO
MDEQQMFRGRDAIAWARRGAAVDREEGARLMRELAGDLPPGHARDDLQAAASQTEAYSRLVSDRGHGQHEADEIDQAYDDLQEGLSALSHHFA